MVYVSRLGLHLLDATSQHVREMLTSTMDPFLLVSHDPALWDERFSSLSTLAVGYLLG